MQGCPAALPGSHLCPHQSCSAEDPQRAHRGHPISRGDGISGTGNAPAPCPCPGQNAASTVHSSVCVQELRQQPERARSEPSEAERVCRARGVTELLSPVSWPGAQPSLAQPSPALLLLLPALLPAFPADPATWLDWQNGSAEPATERALLLCNCAFLTCARTP